MKGNNTGDNSIKAINKVTFKQQMLQYKNNPISFILLCLVLLSAIITVGVLLFLIVYILVQGVPNLTPELFSLEYTSENASLMPALVNTIIITRNKVHITTSYIRFII